MLKSETPQPAAAQPLKEASAVKQIAERIARSAHEGQMEELTGDDYIRHIERVVSLVSGDDAKAVAWLHDVLEDTAVTSAYLIAADIPDEVRLAVERLTRGDEPYAAYIETIRSSGPMLARVVKVADLRDHLRPNCPERLRQRYEKALAALSEVQPPAAATQEDETLALVNQALTKAGSRHIVGTKDGAIVACTIEEALQPAAAAPPIDLAPNEYLSLAMMLYRAANDDDDASVDDRKVARALAEKCEAVARLRALQGTEPS